MHDSSGLNMRRICRAVTASEVSVGSRGGRTPRDHQKEAAVAMDAHKPNFLVAGHNDFIDQQSCPR